MGIKHHLIVVIICTSIMANNIEHVFIGNKDLRHMGIEILINIKNIKILLKTIGLDEIT